MPFLYDRIVKGATITEPDGVPDPDFALPSTIHWMRALAILVRGSQLNFKKASQFYIGNNVGRAVSLTEAQQNTIMEQLFFSIHQLSALCALENINCKSDISRIGLITWYYGIYYAASAMLTAQDGSFFDDHSGTAVAWDKQLAPKNIIMSPFNLRVSSLVAKDTELELLKLRGAHNFSVNKKPHNETEAFGACCSYFSGSIKWYRDKVEKEIKESREFKELGVDNFRTKSARTLRDTKLAKKTVCFLHQAMRYRGKANYREALFLGYSGRFMGYGAQDLEILLSEYPSDLKVVLTGFIAMAGAFVSRRLGKDLWLKFYQDVEENRAFSLSPSGIWT